MCRVIIIKVVLEGPVNMVAEVRSRVSKVAPWGIPCSTPVLEEANEKQVPTKETKVGGKARESRITE